MNNIGEKIFKSIYSETNYSFVVDLTQDIKNKIMDMMHYLQQLSILYYCQDKSTDNILDLLKRMEKRTIINSISCDCGREINNEKFKNHCDENEITLFFIKNDGHKLGTIYRFQNIKRKMNTIFCK